MSNPFKQKGTRFETEVADYLGVERRTMRGNKDEGDLSIWGWVVELKNEKSINLAQYMKEVEVERVNAKAGFGAAIVKRRGKGPAEAYVVMSLEKFRDLAWPERTCFHGAAFRFGTAREHCGTCRDNAAAHF